MQKIRVQVQSFHPMPGGLSKPNRLSGDDCGIHQNRCAQNVKMCVQAGRAQRHENHVRKLIKRKRTARCADPAFCINCHLPNCFNFYKKYALGVLTFPLPCSIIFVEFYRPFMAKITSERKKQHEEKTNIRHFGGVVRVRFVGTDICTARYSRT